MVPQTLSSHSFYSRFPFMGDRMQQGVLIVSIALAALSCLAPFPLICFIALPCMGVAVLSSLFIRYSQQERFDPSKSSLKAPFTPAPLDGSKPGSSPPSGGTDPASVPSSASTRTPQELPFTPPKGACLDQRLGQTAPNSMLRRVYGGLDESIVSDSSQLSEELETLMEGANPAVLGQAQGVQQSTASTPSTRSTLTAPVDGRLFNLATPLRESRVLEDSAFTKKMPSRVHDTFEQLRELVVGFAECITLAAVAAQHTRALKCTAQELDCSVIDFTSVNALAQEVALLFSIANIESLEELAQFIEYVKQKAPVWFVYVDTYQNFAAQDYRELKSSETKEAWESAVKATTRAEDLLLEIQQLQVSVKVEP